MATTLVGMAALANTVMRNSLVGPTAHPFSVARDFNSTDTHVSDQIALTMVVCVIALIVSMFAAIIPILGWASNRALIFRSPASTNEIAYWPLSFSLISSIFVWVFVAWFVLWPMGIAVNVAEAVAMSALSTIISVSGSWKKSGAAMWWFPLAYPISMFLTPFGLFAHIPLYAWIPLSILAILFSRSLPYDIGCARAGVERAPLKDRPYPKWAQALNEGLISSVKAMKSPTEALVMLDLSSARSILLLYSVLPACIIMAVPWPIAIRQQFAYLYGDVYDIRDSLLATCLLVAMGGVICVCFPTGDNNDIRYRYSRPVSSQQIVTARIVTSLVALRQSLFCTSLMAIAGFILPVLLSLYLGCPMRAWIWPTITCVLTAFTTALFINVRGCFTVSPMLFTSSGLVGIGILVLEGCAVAAVLYPFMEMSSASRLVFNIALCIGAAVKLASFAWTLLSAKQMHRVDTYGLSLLRKTWMVGVPYFWTIYFLICPNFPMKLLMLLPMTVIALPMVRPVLALLVVDRERHT